MDDDEYRRRLWLRTLLAIPAGVALGVGLVLLLHEWALVVVLVVGIPWSIREIRWSRRIQREIAEDYERLRRLSAR